jgi:hypothetical protein
MPVTARLSRRFYDTFGEEIADELVGLLNQVGAASRAEMRELFEELRGEMHAGFASLRGDMAAMRADLMKWMFVFWVGGVMATVTLTLSVVGLLRP